MPVAASPLGDLEVWPPTYRSYPDPPVSQTAVSQRERRRELRASCNERWRQKAADSGLFRYVRLPGSAQGYHVF